MSHLDIQRHGPVARVFLNRPWMTTGVGEQLVIQRGVAAARFEPRFEMRQFHG